ncbi:MAG: hypothetical protein MUP80_12370 [Acidobacteriia bacterium]|nr:hypothetical protein [Terriglobia bacterium]
MSVQDEIVKARHLGEQLEEVVVRIGQCPDDDRNILLLGYWALLFDYHKSILGLLSNGLCGGAFALVRPVVEALVRSHVVLMGSDEDVREIREDEYRVNFEKIGSQIDTAFGLDGLFTNFLDDRRTALHSYTHSGTFQLARRFDGHDLKPDYNDDEIIEVVRCSTSAVFMVTNLVTKHLKFEAEAKRGGELFTEWGRH